MYSGQSESPVKRKIKASFVVRAIFAALLGVSWQYGHWGPVLSLILIPLVVMGGEPNGTGTGSPWPTIWLVVTAL